MISRICSGSLGCRDEDTVGNYTYDLIGRKIGLGVLPKVAVLHKDYLSSVRAITNRSGVIDKTTLYTPYGAAHHHRPGQGSESLHRRTPRRRYRPDLPQRALLRPPRSAASSRRSYSDDR
ncbi:hypothetical protein [Microvirga terricola]|uniref:Uncharacterized protein n=1 Tax=Microvirga terricola TaxID=2719797 RepID=A0ABX0VF31_9HYPH|nr:hypothetical protein [Microvirga terricola]NIX78445.1 hypothetical protein [Microvirga terricola]